MHTPEELSTQIAKIEAQFDDVRTRKDELDHELYRLQGDYRTLTALRDAQHIAPLQDALVLEAKPKKEGKENA